MTARPEGTIVITRGDSEAPRGLNHLLVFSSVYWHEIESVILMIVVLFRQERMCTVEGE